MIFKMAVELGIQVYNNSTAIFSFSLQEKRVGDVIAAFRRHREEWLIEVFFLSAYFFGGQADMVLEIDYAPCPR